LSTTKDGKKDYELLQDQSYGEKWVSSNPFPLNAKFWFDYSYPCRTFQ